MTDRAGWAVPCTAVALALSLACGATSQAATNNIFTVAGTTIGFSGLGLAATADGGFLIADRANHRIRRVSPAGTIMTVAGTTAGFSGDGGPATAAQLNQPSGVAASPDGGFLVADNNNHRVRRVDAHGTITTVAGTTAGFSGDGGLAVTAQLNHPAGVAMTADGGYVVSDQFNDRIRRVSPAGTIATVAGSTRGVGGDGGPAIAARLDTPSGVAVSPDGGLLIADEFDERIRRVSPAGTITTVAGTGIGTLSGDGGPATAAGVGSPPGVAATAEGGFLVADTDNSRIRFVDADLRGRRPRRRPSTRTADAPLRGDDRRGGPVRRHEGQPPRDAHHRARPQRPQHHPPARSSPCRSLQHPADRNDRPAARHGHCTADRRRALTGDGSCRAERPLHWES